jgi:predicted acylesterase/phospholipase RssA
MENIFASLINMNIEPPIMDVIDLSNTDLSAIAMNIPKNQIKHLVLSGGGCWGLYMQGILSEAVKTGFIDKSKIETIHCTSVGCVVGVFFALNYEDGVIEDYLVKRPWKNVLKCKSNTFIEMYEKYGIFTVKAFEDIFELIFTAADLTLDVTLLDFYMHTGVEIHMYATELNTYKLVDFSYKTHPDWRVCDAVYASCSVPIIFSPIITETACYIDGGLLANYPIGQLFESRPAVDVEPEQETERDSEPVSESESCQSLNKSEIFGINVIEQKESICITSKIFVSIENFLFCIFYKIIEYFGSFHKKIDLLYEIEIVKSVSLISFSYNTILHREYRENIIDSGRQMFREHAFKWWQPIQEPLADCPTDDLLFDLPAEPVLPCSP